MNRRNPSRRFRRLRGFHLPISFLLVLLLACVSAAAQQEALKLPSYKKTQLPNGITALLMEKHAVPLVSFQITLRTGTTADPPGKEGLAGITNDLLRKGTPTRTADQISADLDFIGAALSTTESPDSLRVYAEFMKKDVATGLDLLADILRNPTFPQEEADKLIKRRIDGIRSAKDQAQAVIGNYFDAFLYGGHPYGRPVEGDERSLAAITRDDIAKFYRQQYVPGNMIVAVVGDLSAADMEKLLADRLGSMPRASAPAIQAPEPKPATGRRLLLVDKPDSTQTFFRIGNVGVSRTNPDRVAIRVVNTLFGGRFTSMINSALRIRSGLTYGANSSFAQYRQAGPFAIASYTRNASTEKALDMALAVLKELHEKGVSEEQLASAKNYIKGQFPTRIETNDQLAGLLADLELYGLGRGEVDELYARVDAVTAADARRVIKQHFPLENLVFTLIGKSSEIAPLAKKYATDIQTKSITAPGF